MKRLLAILLSGSATVAAAQQDLPFATAEVRSLEIPRERVLDGTVEAVNASTISAQTAGEVVEVLYDVDDFVEKDAVIIRIKAKNQSASTRQAEAGLAEAQARLNQAEQEYERVKSIFDRQLVARSQLDTATAELNAARARMAAATAELSKARENLGNTQVRAPYAGIVTDRQVEVGEFVNVGQPLMTGISLDKLRVNVAVSQELVGAVRKNKQARVILPSGASNPVENLTVFPYADAATNTFQVRANLTEAAEDVFPGMYVKVAFTTGSQVQLVVPETAIARRSEVTGVYVLDEHDMPSLRYVRLGQLTGDGNVIVLSGLKVGDRIALDPIAAGIYYKRHVQQQGAASHE